MAVRIRLKRMGRRHRPFYRVCAMDSRSPRDGRVIEELGHYDPMLPEKDARAVLRPERIDYWIGVGAQPTEKVAVLIKKYGTDGSHLDAQAAALSRLSNRKPTAPPPMVVVVAQPEEEAPAESEAADDATADDATADDVTAPAADASAGGASDGGASDGGNATNES